MPTNLQGTPIRLRIINPNVIYNDYTYDTLFDYDTEETIEYGGGSSGKSHGVYQKYVNKAMGKWQIPRRIVVWRKVRATLKDSSFQHVKDVLSQFQMLQYCRVNKTELTITLPNLAEILFKGLDDPEKAKSIKGISDNVLEELTDFTLDDYTQIKMRTRDKDHIKRQITGMLNPVSKLNWVYPYFFSGNTHGATLHHSTYKDNRFLDEAVGRNLEDLAERNPAYYRIYALGEFATLDKLVYPNAVTQLLDVELMAKLPMYIGLDFGYVNDPSALVVVRYDKPNKTIYVTHEYVKGNMLNDEIANTITILGYQKESIYADSAEQKSIAEIRALGVERIKAVPKAPNSVIQGIQWLNQHKIVINEFCPKTIAEIQNYTWKKNPDGTWGGRDGKTPIDTYNHTLDALRYALADEIKVKAGIQMEQGNAW